MTLPTLAWERHTTTFSLAGSTPTLAEFLTKISNFITASSTYWKVTGSDIGVGVANAGYVELAPKDATAGITEMRLLIGYTDAGTAVAINSNNRAAPFGSITTSNRIWFGGSPNAATSGPNANPYSGKAYSTAGWGGMFPVYSGSAVLPTNGAELAIIESNEALVITFFSAANQINVMGAGYVLESADGNSKEFGQFCSVSQATSDPTSYTQSWMFPRIYQNNSTSSTVAAKGFTIDSSSTLKSLNMSFESAGNVDLASHTSGTNAYFQAVLASGGAWGGGDLGTGRGAWRQMRLGPAAWNGQKITDGTTEQGIAICYHASVAHVALWFDQQR